MKFFKVFYSFIRRNTKKKGGTFDSPVPYEKVCFNEAACFRQLFHCRLCQD